MTEKSREEIDALIGEAEGRWRSLRMRRKYRRARKQYELIRLARLGAAVILPTEEERELVGRRLCQRYGLDADADWRRQGDVMLGVAVRDEDKPNWSHHAKIVFAALASLEKTNG